MMDLSTQATTPTDTLSGGNPYIYGLNDKGGEPLLLVDGEAKGWVLVIEAIGGAPNQTGTGDFTDLTNQGLGVLVRLSRPSEASGTIPLEQDYAAFAQQVAQFVARSQGGHRWIIGNEMNLEREQPRRPDTGTLEPITPRRYARCFKLCRDAIHALAGHENDEVITGPIGPWNVQTSYAADPEGKYSANPSGDWNLYLRDMLLAIGAGSCDGIALHTYTHGYQPERVFSDGKMAPPFQNYYFEFRAYRDQLSMVPAAMRQLPVYITETNGDREPDGQTWPFGNNGWIKNAYREINTWNRSGQQLIRCLLLFRWQINEFGWSIADKPGVQQDLREAIARNYRALIAPEGDFYGLNIDPLNSLGNPSATQLLDLGVQNVRFAYKDATAGPDLDLNRAQFYQHKIETLFNAGISSTLILTGESIPGAPAASASDADWDNYITRFADRAARIAQTMVEWQPALQIWNEPDLPNPSPAYNPTLRPAVYARMLTRCHNAIKAVNANLKIVTAGLVSGQPSYLQQVFNAGGGKLSADAIAVHPYDQRPEPTWPSANWRAGYVGDLIDRYRQVTVLPQWLTEAGVNDLNIQAEYLTRLYKTIRSQDQGFVERVHWFAYSDAMAAPYGLVNATLQPKPAAEAYRTASAIPITPPGVKTYAVGYLSHNTPAIMVANQRVTVQLTIRNNSNWTWPAGGTNQVRLGYRWHLPNGTEVSPDLWDDLRASLPFNLAPGQSVPLSATLAAPKVAGSYQVRWDMVEEQRTWFSWQGTPTLNVSVEVRSTDQPPGQLRVSASHNNVQTGADNLLQAIDGNPTTRWATRALQQPGMWFQIDLGEVRSVGQVRLDNAGSPQDHPRGYRVEVSTNASSWTTVAEKPTNDQPLNVTFSPRSARYVRIVQTGRADQFWWSIHEVTVADEVRPTVRASHNNVFTGPNSLSFVFDGDINTRWATRAIQEPGMWFEIDLNETKAVSGLRLDSTPSPNDYPLGYLIQLSLDGQQWVTVAQNPNNTGSVNVDFTARSARYIRIEQTGRSDRWWWAIHEIEVKTGELGLTATASHNNVSSGADNILQALDGRPETRWSSRTPQRPGMWFEIDLNRVRTVNGLRLESAGSPNDFPRGYIVRVSTDRQQWLEVARNPNNDQALDINFSAQEVRYLRIEQTGTSDTWWWSINEVVVKFGQTTLSARASHNNTLTGTDNLTQALDGQTNTRWSTQTLQQPGMWFELDLGASRTVRGLALDNAQSTQDYPRGYVVQVSENRQTWQEVARQPTNDRPLDIDFTPRPVRYLRIEQTSSSSSWWWSIHRVTVKE